MVKYTKPELEITEFEIVDILTATTGRNISVKGETDYNNDISGWY